MGVVDIVAARYIVNRKSVFEHKGGTVAVGYIVNIT